MNVMEGNLVLKMIRKSITSYPLERFVSRQPLMLLPSRRYMRVHARACVCDNINTRGCVCVSEKDGEGGHEKSREGENGYCYIQCKHAHAHIYIQKYIYIHTYRQTDRLASGEKISSKYYKYQYVQRCKI